MALLALRKRRRQDMGPDRVNATLAAPLGGANVAVRGWRINGKNCHIRKKVFIIENSARRLNSQSLSTALLAFAFILKSKGDI
jgi:hypothetical protein